MEMQSPSVKLKPSVRWPIRILAALVVLAGMVAIVGFVADVWTHRQPLAKWQSLASLPGILWLVRQAWCAAIQGRSPADPAWPFATERFLFFYFAAWVAVYLL
ncbi:hypothetical protein [Dyella japonica]|jgi:hypothetical protein|uniref:Uncharacterized protein n=1 Tax=Dyella japonica DSM 16301 TaxID=1440762 RepID=A0A0G9H1M6_9GAMM|nr:hypothetical protein [Dyella japonica]KLD63406.1 hypothetical protein Y882_11570 [Dyella japonica DSM 16301]